MLKIDFEGYRQGKDHEFPSRSGPKVTPVGWKLRCERSGKRCVFP